VIAAFAWAAHAADVVYVGFRLFDQRGGGEMPQVVPAKAGEARLLRRLVEPATYDIAVVQWRPPVSDAKT
jgi:hypothetical protein